VLAPHVFPHLADRFQEREALDVADRAAHLHDHHVRPVVPRDADDPLLDLVRDVGDDLDRAAEVIPPALLGDDRLVDPAGGHVRELREVLVDEALVVAQVQVRLGAIVGDEDFAVLVRRHRPRIDVDVGVELEDGDGDPACLQQAADAGGGDALPEGGGDPSGHKDILRHRTRSSGVFPMLPESGRVRQTLPRSRKGYGRGSTARSTRVLQPPGRRAGARRRKWR
jgi:hypothetical protein